MLVARIPQRIEGLCEGGNHQPVPGGDDFLITQRRYTLLAMREQRIRQSIALSVQHGCTGLKRICQCADRIRAMQNAALLKVS